MISILRWYTTFAYLLLIPAIAMGHPLDPSLLRLYEDPGGKVRVEWSTPAQTPADIELTPRLPAVCTPLESPSNRLSADGKRLISTWHADCGVGDLARTEISIAGLATAGTDALLRIERADGTVLQTVLRPAAPVFDVPDQQSTMSVAGDYARLGFGHILAGLDHLLFVLGLLLLIDGFRRLLATITAFTVGHSVTLALSSLGHVRVEPALAEILIAGSILLLAIELIITSPGHKGLTRRRPWLVAGGFGLVHGLGFAGALAEVGLPEGDLPLALASFNLGIEAGQLAFVLLALSLLSILSSIYPAGRPVATRLAAYAIGIPATFWMLERLLGAL